MTSVSKQLCESPPHPSTSSRLQKQPLNSQLPNDPKPNKNSISNSYTISRTQQKTCLSFGPLRSELLAPRWPLSPPLPRSASAFPQARMRWRIRNPPSKRPLIRWIRRWAMRLWRELRRAVSRRIPSCSWPRDRSLLLFAFADTSFFFLFLFFSFSFSLLNQEKIR